MVRQETKSFGKFPFSYVCHIQPDRNHSGGVRRLMAQSRYGNSKGLPLHRYGQGLFCRFRTPRGLSLEGVYALLVDGSIRYVGECLDLSFRFNMG